MTMGIILLRTRPWYLALRGQRGRLWQETRGKIDGILLKGFGSYLSVLPHTRALLDAVGLVYKPGFGEVVFPSSRTLKTRD